MKHIYCPRGKVRSCVYAVPLFLALLWSGAPVQAQDNLTIQGRVLSAADNEVLPGASVQLRGSNQGTTTDENGSFTFTVSGRRIVLRVSFIGYLAVDTTLALPLKQELVIQLHQDAQVLEGVTVSTGYWETSKRLSTGNISKVTAEVIEKQPILNPLQALQGRIPGVYIQQNTGVPGGGFSVLIRGRNSLRNDANEPLYVVNGVPFPSVSLHSNSVISANSSDSPLNTIDPSNILSIEILKDADATSIYGSRGSNGVVLITTKQGEFGKTDFDLGISSGISHVSRKMKLLNTQQYLEMRQEAFDNNEAAYNSWDYDMKVWDRNNYTDWQDELIGGTANQLKLQSSFSAGTKNTHFLIKGGYYRETSVFPSDFSYRRGYGNLDVRHRSNSSKLEIGLTTGFSADKNQLPSLDLTSLALTLAPNAPRLFDEQGNLNWENSTWTNPLSEVAKHYTGKSNNLSFNNTIRYRPHPNWSIRVSTGYNLIVRDQMSLEPLKAQDPAYASTARARFGNSNYHNWIIEPQIDYRFTKSRFGEIDILAGGTLQRNYKFTQGIVGSGYTSDLLLENIAAAPVISISPATSRTEYAYTALFGRVNYRWNSKYLLNITTRRDGSSRFGPDRRFENFGAIGAAWIFSQERFAVKMLPGLNFGKLRGSFGITGNDQIPDYGFLDTYIATTRTYGGKAGLIPSRLANADFSWETNRKLELAMEISFIKDRVSLNISYYRNRSSNQLVGYPTPTTTGFRSVQYNLPAIIENTGLEIDADFRIISKEDFSWRANLNFTIPRGKLVAYPEIERSTYNNTFVVGKSLGIVKRYRQMGLDPSTGYYTFNDTNNDGVLSANDYTAIKQIGQNWYGGLQNVLAYKGFQLDLLLQFVNQTASSYQSFFNLPGVSSNQPIIVMNRWRTQGDETSIQKFTQNSSREYLNNRSSDNIVVAASFLRVRNVSLSYNLAPLRISSTKKMRGKVFLHCQNLFTFTNYVGMDPETGPGRLPPLRTIMAGLNFTFF